MLLRLVFTEISGQNFFPDHSVIFFRNEIIVVGLFIFSIVLANF